MKMFFYKIIPVHYKDIGQNFRRDTHVIGEKYMNSGHLFKSFDTVSVQETAV